METTETEDTTTDFKKIVCILKSNDIFVAVNDKITQYSNSKKDFKDRCDNWGSEAYGKGIVNMPIQETETLNNLIKNGAIGGIIKTDKNCIIVDWDIKPPLRDCYRHIDSITDKSSVSPTDMSIYENYRDALKLLELLKASKTLYCKTPSGGFHFLFKGDKEVIENAVLIQSADGNDTIKQRRCINIYGNVDILTNGGIAFIGNREDGTYAYNFNNKLEKMPTELKDILIEQMTKPDYAVSFKKNKASNYKYNINKEEFKAFLDFVACYDKKYLDNTKLWKHITAVSKIFDMKDIWDEWSKKSDQYNAKRNTQIWKEMDNRINPTHTPKKLVYDINKGLERKHKKQIPYFERILVPYDRMRGIEGYAFEKIETKYLNVSYYENDYKCLIFYSPCCTGKTYTTFMYIIKNKLRLICICHLISICENQMSYNPLLREHIWEDAEYAEWTEDEKEAEYNSRKMILYSDTTNIKDYINNPYSKNSITITFNSLIKIENHIKNAPIENPFVLYLDEASRSIPYSLSCCTLDNICKDTQRTLRNTIKTAKKVIITDGTIDEPLMKFVKNTGMIDNFKMYINYHKPFSGVPMIIRKHSSFEDIKPLISKILIDNSNNCYTFCGTCKRDCVITYEYTLNGGKLKEDVFLNTADTSQSYALISATKMLDGKVWIYSPKITEGMDRKTTKKQIVIAYIRDINSLGCEGVIQQICRTRNPLKVYVFFGYMKNELPYDTRQEFINKLQNKVSVFCNTELIDGEEDMDAENQSKLKYENETITQYQNLANKTYNEDRDDYIYNDNTISELYAYTKWNEYENKANMTYSISKKAEMKGFEVEYDYSYYQYDKPNEEYKRNEKEGKVYYTIEAREEDEDYFKQDKANIEEMAEGIVYNILFKEGAEQDPFNTELYNKITNKKTGTLNYIGTDLDTIKKIVSGDKKYYEEFKLNILNDISEENEEQNKKLYKHIGDAYINILAKGTEGIKNVRYFIQTDEQLDDTIMYFKKNDLDYKYAVKAINKIKCIRKLIRNYADKINIYTLGYSTEDPYINEKIVLSQNDCNMLNELDIRTKIKIGSIKTRKALLTYIQIIIKSMFKDWDYFDLGRVIKNTSVYDKETNKKKSVRKYEYSYENALRTYMYILKIGGVIDRYEVITYGDHKDNTEYNKLAIENNITDKNRIFTKYIEVKTICPILFNLINIDLNGMINPYYEENPNKGLRTRLMIENNKFN